MVGDGNRAPTRRGTHAGDTDPFGFDDTPNHLSDALRALVPQWLSQRSIEVSVSTDREEYTVGDSVDILIDISNRLPFPITVATAHQRIWGWTVDGELEASDERRHEPERPADFDMKGFETKRLEVTWDGQFKREGSPTRWVEPDPGVYEIGAFVTTTHEPSRDSTTITLR